MTMSSAAVVSLVARREMGAKLRDKGFLLSTGFIAVAILASVLLPAAFGGDEGRYEVGTVGEPELLAPAVEAQAAALDVTVELTPYADEDAARSALEAEEIDAVLSGQQILVVESVDLQLQRLLDQANRDTAAVANLGEAGIDAAAVAEAFDVPPLEVVSLDPAAERDSQREFVALLGIIVLYGLLLLIGQYVAMGVVEEKASRVVELLLSTIRPWQLLAGKVIGLGILGLVQLVVIGVAGLGAAVWLDVLAVPGDAVGTLVQVVGWYVLGYAFYAAVFAAGAALVSRQEDLQTVLMPMIVLLVGALLIAIQAGANPDGTLAVVTSFVPGLSPLVMPVRSAAGAAAWWEVVLAVLLMLAAIVALVRVGGRIYAGALLRTGGRVKIKSALSGVS